MGMGIPTQAEEYLPFVSCVAKEALVHIVKQKQLTGQDVMPACGRAHVVVVRGHP